MSLNINSNSLSERDLASRWCKTGETIRKLRRSGKTPPHFSVGVSTRYLVSEVEKFEQNSRH
ncbi:MAG: hypothetical protein ACXW0Q_05745 [Methylovulum sp.]